MKISIILPLILLVASAVAVSSIYQAGVEEGTQEVVEPQETTPATPVRFGNVTAANKKMAFGSANWYPF